MRARIAGEASGMALSAAWQKLIKLAKAAASAQHKQKRKSASATANVTATSVNNGGTWHGGYQSSVDLDDNR